MSSLLLNLLGLHFLFRWMILPFSFPDAMGVRACMKMLGIKQITENKAGTAFVELHCWFLGYEQGLAAPASYLWKFHGYPDNCSIKEGEQSIPEPSHHPQWGSGVRVMPSPGHQAPLCLQLQDSTVKGWVEVHFLLFILIPSCFW